MVGGTISEKSQADVVSAPCSSAQTGSNRRGQATTDQPIGSKQTARRIVQVHGAAAPAATAIALAVQLGHQGIWRHALGQRMAMAPVCAGDPVGLAQMRTNPNARGLLADVEVQKTRRLAFSAGHLGSELEPTQQQHLLI